MQATDSTASGDVEEGREEHRPSSTRLHRAAAKLIEVERATHYGTIPNTKYNFEVDDHTKYGSVDDPMTYDLLWLSTFYALTGLNGTVWRSRSLWRTFSMLMMISVASGLASYLLLPNPEYLNVSKFSEVTAVFSVFVSLMLSFYLSSSVSRWINCVDGFLMLFNAIRNLSLQFHALGVENKKTTRCLRYGLLSCWFLWHELKNHALSDEKKKENWDDFWAHLEKSQAVYTHIESGEKKTLEMVGDVAVQMWMWVSSYIGRMALDGDLPDMKTATFGRIMNLCQDAQSGLRQVRTCVIVQLPFLYVHTLAVLVHVNSILLVICAGLSVGVVYHGMKEYAAHYWSGKKPDPNIQVEPLTSLIQSLIVELLKGVVAPLLYQATLQISIMIASPFHGSESAIPVNRLIHELERDLKHAKLMAENTPWKTPSFKSS